MNAMKVPLRRATGCTILTAVLALPAAADDSRPVKRLSIVDRAIAFHGGELYRSSETEMDVCSLPGCYHLKVRTEGGLFDHTVSSPPGRRQRTVRTTNETVERWDDGEPVPVTPEQEQRLRDWGMARVYFAFLPYRLNDPSVDKQDLGLEEWDGRPLHKIRVTFEPGSGTNADDAYLYWLDPESGRVELFAYSFKGSPGGLRFRRAFNYRRIGGILFFDQENWGIDAPNLTVDMVSPTFVAEKMELISTVRLKDIDVRPLASRSNQ